MADPATDAVTDPTPPTHSWLRRLVAVCWERRGLSILVLLSSVSTIALAAVAPVLTRNAVNDAVAGDTGRLWWLALILVAIAALDFVGNFVRRNTAGQLSLWVQHTLRERVFDSIQRLDGSGQDALRTGQVVSRTNSDLQQLHTMLQMCPVPLSVATYYLVGLVIMLWLSPPLTVIVVTVIVLLGVTAWRTRSRVFAASARASDDLADLTEHVRGVVDQVSVVKSFVAEAREVRWLDRESRRLFARRMEATRIQAVPGATLLALPVLGQVAVLVYGGWSALEGHIDLGTFVAFVAFLTMLTGPTRVLASFLVIAQRTRVSAERVFALTDARPSMRDGDQDVPGGPVELTFEDVAFGYGDPASAEPVLRGVSLSVMAGETVAVVGASGSGKSTLSLLIARFYDPSAGSISLGSCGERRELSEIRLESLRREVGVVFEDTFLFAGTIGENIAYGHPAATAEEILAAARAAGAAGFVEELPEAYETRIGDSAADLSGGQRQRIALARALLDAPRLLVVDDATSALDASTEAEVNQALRAYAGTDRALLMIARRRSTLDLADRIVVLDEGRVVDTGTREELTERCPQFRALVSGAGDSLETTGEGLWPEEPETTPAAVEPERRGAVARLLLDLPARAARAVADGIGDRVTALLRPVAGLFAAGLVLISLDAAATVAIPIVLQRGIDDGVIGGAMPAVLTAAGVGLGLVALSWVAYGLQTLVSARASEAVQYAVRVRSLDQLLRLGLPYHERHGGTSLTRMTVDVDALARFLQNGLVNGLMSLITILGIAIAMFVLDPLLATAALGSMPLIAVATLVYRRLSSKAYTQARTEIGKVNRSLQEKVAGLRVVQAHGRQSQESKRFSELSDKHRTARSRAQRYVALYFPFVTFCAEASYAVVLLVGARQVAVDAVSPGVLTAFLLLVSQLYGPIQQLSNIVDSYQQATASSRRVDELLGAEGTETLGEPDPAVRLRGDLVLEDLTFTYPEAHRPALDGLSLRVPAGTSIAVVGASGAGKSTLVKLVTGFYAPSAGRVLVGDHDTASADPASYRRRVGLVSQDVGLFDADLADNIRYPAPEASDEEVEAAARAVGAIPAVASLPDGFRTEVTRGGASLSAGQRQLTALARAQLADPDLLVLDEATARLDGQAEEAVLAAVTAGGRTAVVVAHRLSTAARCDRIAVMAAGRIVELGTHAELVEADGAYARLWRDANGPSTDPSDQAGLVGVRLS